MRRLRRHPLAQALLGIGLASLVLSGCGGGSAGGDGAASAGPTRADQVVIAISGDEGTLTPYTQNTGYPGSNLVALIYDKLLELDKDNNPKPLLAQSIQAAPANDRFVLTLRQGVTWQDGQPFTAADVVFSVGYYQKNTVADSAPQLQDVAGVTADGNTVTFRLKRPDPEFPKRLLADMRILPKHIWQNVKDPTKVTAQQAIGTGPYKLVSYKKDQGYEFVANEKYAMGKPKIARLQVKIIPQQQTALAALRTREISMYSGTVPEEQAAGLARQRGITIVRGSGFASTLLAFNNQRAPFTDPRVRAAIAKAIDKKALVQTVLRGRGTVGSAGFWHPDAAGATALDQTFDASAAGAELDQLGAKPGADGIRVLAGKPMSFNLLVQSTSPQRIRAAELIRDMLKKVGIAVAVQSMDADSVTAKVWPEYDVSKGRSYDMTMWGWSGPVMLDSTMMASLVDSDTSLGRLNITGTKDPQLDRLSQQLLGSPTLEARMQVLATMQQQVAQQVPFVTLYYAEGAYAYRQDVFDGWVYQNGQGILNKMSYVALSG